MSRRILLTGGGTAGHVTPNLALIDILKQEGWQIYYAGSALGIEKSMIEGAQIPYHIVSSGKLRRYFSWKNFLDPFKIFLGVLQATILMRRIKPSVVFSKGGFVAFPVVVGAWINRIPIIAHESDMSPGLANRLSFPFVNKICVTFAPAINHFKKKAKVIVTGTPIRNYLFSGSIDRGLSLCGFTSEKPCILIIGGSQGAQAINNCVRDALSELCKRYQIIHICGKGKVDEGLTSRKNYCQLEYVHEELADLFAASQIIISRSGANSLFEILALNKPHVLIPLPKRVSRGDQIQNAYYFKQQGASTVIDEDKLTSESLFRAIQEVSENWDERINRIQALNIHSGNEAIIRLIKSVVKDNNRC